MTILVKTVICYLIPISICHQDLAITLETHYMWNTVHRHNMKEIQQRQDSQVLFQTPYSNPNLG